MTYPIPIVDLEQFNICKEPEDVSDDVQRQLAAQIIDAFSTVGFVGLKNYGIPQDKVKHTWQSTCMISGLTGSANLLYTHTRTHVRTYTCMHTCMYARTHSRAHEHTTYAAQTHTHNTSTRTASAHTHALCACMLFLWNVTFKCLFRLHRNAKYPQELLHLTVRQSNTEQQHYIILTICLVSNNIRWCY